MDYYGTANGFRDYHTARGRNVSAYVDDDAVVDAALLIASEWLDATYRNLFRGYKVGQRVQVREWPRYAVTDFYGYAVSSNAVPVEVENATYEAAWRELQTTGSLLKDYSPNKYKSVSIAGAVSVTYEDRKHAGDIQSQFPVIDQILDPLLGGFGYISPLSGRTVRA